MQTKPQPRVEAIFGMGGLGIGMGQMGVLLPAPDSLPHGGDGFKLLLEVGDGSALLLEDGSSYLLLEPGN